MIKTFLYGRGALRGRVPFGVPYRIAQSGRIKALPWLQIIVTVQ
jgi:hypothetical protein